MADRKVLEARLAELRNELGKVEGRPTEVYSRIVGYYRSVRNWNAGKRAEYSNRLVYGLPGDEAVAQAPGVTRYLAGLPVDAGTVPAALPAAAVVPSPSLFKVAGSASGAPRPLPEARAERSGVLVFTRKACPNCPPVADFVTTAGLPAVFVDVDGDEGLALARRHGVPLHADGRRS